MYIPPKIITKREAPASVEVHLSVTQAYHLWRLLSATVDCRSLEKSQLEGLVNQLQQDIVAAKIDDEITDAWGVGGCAVSFHEYEVPYRVRSRLEELDAQA